MSERYSRLFLLPQNLYAEGSPVLICAGALLKDNLTGKVLAQLKLQNLDAPIKGVTVTVQPLDTVGDPLGAAVQHQYLDLSVPTGVQFGEKQPFFLPNAAARSFTAAVTEVIFADNTVWTDTAGLWTPLAPPKPLSTALEDPALEDQYCLHFGSICHYMPATERGTWCCTCGQRHLTKTEVCSSCGKSAADLFALDLNSLQKELDARLEEEKQQAEEKRQAEEKLQQAEAAAAARAEKTKKTLLTAAPIAAVVIAVLLIVSAVLKKAERTNAYNAAVTLSEEGRIEEAIAAFTALGDYEDSVERLEALEEDRLHLRKYESAHDALKSKDYNKALKMFIELGDYKDSEEMVSECKYRRAEQLLAGETDHEHLAAQAEAYELFCAIKDYKDSQEYIDAFSMRLTSETIKSETGSSNHTYQYNAAGLLASYCVDGVTCSVRQEKLGNWYICEGIRGDGSAEFIYKSPYLPEKDYYEANIKVHGIINWNSIEYKNNIIVVTIEDDDLLHRTITCSLYDDGNYSYQEKGEGDYLMIHHVTINADSNGNFLSTKNTGNGTWDNGDPYTIKETSSHSFDDRGNCVKYNESREISLNGFKSISDTAVTYDIKYNEDGTVASKTTTYDLYSIYFETTSTFSYAPVYCPDKQ